MEQLQLLELDRESSSMVALTQELRDQVIRQMAEAILIVFKAKKGENDESIPSENSI